MKHVMKLTTDDVELRDSAREAQAVHAVGFWTPQGRLDACQIPRVA